MPGDRDFFRELAVAESAARRAGAIILAHYRAPPIDVAAKADGSPVSRADLEANAAILAALRAAFPADAVLSEESPDDERRLGADRVWIVDPLDGTRGFLARTDDFAVHVALAIRGVPTVAVVYQPVGTRLYRAIAGQGAFLELPGAAAVRLSVSRRGLAEARIGTSRHNLPAALTTWLEAHGLADRAVALGGSLKYTALAEGKLDAVVTITRSEKEWDTCAPGLIVEEAGGRLCDGHGGVLRYNQPPDQIDRRDGIIVSNGVCHDELLKLAAPLFA